MKTSELPQTVTPTKKPYAKPEIVYQQPLEAMAAACTPIGPGQGKANSGTPDFCAVINS